MRVNFTSLWGVTASNVTLQLEKTALNIVAKLYQEVLWFWFCKIIHNTDNYTGFTFILAVARADKTIKGLPMEKTARSVGLGHIRLQATLIISLLVSFSFTGPFGCLNFFQFVCFCVSQCGGIEMYRCRLVGYLHLWLLVNRNHPSQKTWADSIIL